MGCFLVLLGAFVPRIALFLWWIFGDKLAVVFDNFILPFIGFIFLPYTTLFYALVWSPVGGVRGLGWLVVVFAFLLDLSHWFGSDRERRRRGTAQSAA
ncbi:MAG: hypothetical protein IT198_12425 [Acidimicrobiia bacterium]|nr:hypothetical protein [Acidimicrobiia bacterium]